MDAIELNHAHAAATPFGTVAEAEEMAALFRKHSIGAIRYGDTFTVIVRDGRLQIIQDIKNG